MKRIMQKKGLYALTLSAVMLTGTMAHAMLPDGGDERKKSDNDTIRADINQLKSLFAPQNADPAKLLRNQLIGAIRTDNQQIIADSLHQIIASLDANANAKMLQMLSQAFTMALQKGNQATLNLFVTPDVIGHLAAGQMLCPFLASILHNAFIGSNLVVGLFTTQIVLQPLNVAQLMGLLATARQNIADGSGRAEIAAHIDSIIATRTHTEAKNDNN